MTIDRAISEFDSLFPNALDYEHKKNTLLRLEKRVYGDIFSRYENGISPEYPTLTGDASPHEELLIAAPYDELYVKYLACTMDYVNSDLVRYANSANLFNCLFIEFANGYNRTHRWKRAEKGGKAS